MFIDTHCHIFNEYYNNIDELIEDCKINGISKIIVNGCDIKSNMEVIKLISKYNNVYGAIGFHPTELRNIVDDDICLEWLENNIDNKKIVAVGEIGLDYHYNDTDKEKQLMMFKRQLDIATKYNKPVIIHSRDSIQDTYNLLKKYKLNGSIHCFSGSVEMARLFTSLGYKIGIGGIITYKNAKTIKEVVRDTDLAYILLETDSPYLAPEPYRGKSNRPSYIPIIADEIARLKNTSRTEVARVTTMNAEAIFDFFSE